MTPDPLAPFSLVKWYMDCVTCSGETVIFYSASLRWRGVAARMASLLECTGGSPPRTRSSLRNHTISPATSGLRVEHPSFQLRGQWESAAPAFQATIYETVDGSVHWNCVQPASRVTLHLRGRELNGYGYAECLTLTLPPWRLPLRQLRWGRYVSAAHSLAWIDWEGGFSTHLAIFDGQPLDLLSATETAIKTSAAHLQFSDSTPLRTGPVRTTVLPGLPLLAKLFPAELLAIEEHKWRSCGTLSSPQSHDTGWAIHELVRWPEASA